jgi:hypothetical protein
MVTEVGGHPTSTDRSMPVVDMAREVERAIELGVQRSQVYLEDRGTDAALPILDDLAIVVEQVGAS